MVRNVAIVSLSSGTIGEDFARHEVEIGLRRLEEYGLQVKMMPHAMMGIEYVKNHPAERAEDLLRAFHAQGVEIHAELGHDSAQVLDFFFGDATGVVDVFAQAADFHLLEFRDQDFAGLDAFRFGGRSVFACRNLRHGERILAGVYPGLCSGTRMTKSG